MSQRVKHIKGDKAGTVEVVSNNVAHQLIESGVAILSKDMVARDYKTKRVRRGRST